MIARAVRAVSLVLLCGALLPGAAHAQDVDAAVDGLRAAPLYVDRALAASLTDGERRVLVRDLRAADEKILVALVPLVPGDAVGGEPRAFLDVLRRRLGTDAVLATVDGGSLTVEPGRVTSEGEEERLYAASTVANLEGEYREPTFAVLERFLDALGDPDVVARARRAGERLSRGRATPTPSAPARDGGDGDGPWGGLLVALGACGVAVLLVRRRRRIRVASSGPPVLPAHVFAAARNARTDQLRRTLEDELVAFAELLDRSPTPGAGAAAERWQRALEHRDVAAAIARDAAGLDVDLVGALVLEDTARAELAAATALAAGRTLPVPAPPPCALNPTHPRSVTHARWGGAPALPVCAECSADIRTGRRPDVLDDRGRAYLEQKTAWAATAFGTLPGDLLAAVRADRARRR